MPKVRGPVKRIRAAARSLTATVQYPYRRLRDPPRSGTAVRPVATARGPDAPRRADARARHGQRGRPLRITALTPQERRPERFNLFVDGEFRCGLAAEIAYAEGLHVGREVSEALLRDLERKDQLWQAREVAFHLLSHRSRTAAELRRRLRRKAFADDVIEECVAHLTERGFVDDEAFAAAFVRDRLRSRPRGVRRLVDELRERGVAPDLAEGIVERTLADEGASELDLAREVAAKWARRTLGSGERRRSDPWEQRRRLYGYLSRRGFGSDVVHTVLEEVLGRPD